MGCLRCGDCCTYVALEIRPYSAPWLEMHGVPLVEQNGVKKLIIDMPCKHYDPETRLCLIHEGERPDICKDYLCEKARGDDGHS